MIPLWVTNGAIQGNVVTATPDVNGGGRFMDRNLGALAAITSQPVVNEAYKYFGLLYQWGRKEPFTGQGNTLTVNTPAAIYNAEGAIYTPAPAAGGTGGFTYQGNAAANMTTLIRTPLTHYNGLSGSPQAGESAVITGNPNTWSDYGTNNKSIYDPCPYGYRVPKNGSWNGFTINCPLNADGTNNADPTQWTNGSIIGGSIWNSTWWPTTGGRNFTSAGSYGVGRGGDYWASSPYPTPYLSYYLGFYYAGGIHPSSWADRSFGLSVRCVQE